MLKGTKRELERIEKALLKGDEVARELWTVLTALRSCDEEHATSVKLATTVRVRQAAFPKLASQAQQNHYHIANGAIVYSIANGAIVYSDAMPVSAAVLHDMPWHWFNHYRDACDVLGIYKSFA